MFVKSPAEPIPVAHAAQLTAVPFLWEIPLQLMVNSAAAHHCRVQGDGAAALGQQEGLGDAAGGL